jgi:hypothetical protein
MLGTVNTRQKEVEVDLALDASSSDLGVWLRRFELPPLATQASRARILVKGPLTDPSISIDTSLRGVKGVGELNLVATIDGTHVQLSQISTGGLGGKLSGSGAISLGAAPTLERLTLRGAGVSAERLGELTGGKTPVRGTLDYVDLAARGRLDRLGDLDGLLALADVEVRSRELEIAGETFHDVGVCVNRPEAVACQRVDAPPSPAELSACRGATAADGACLTVTATRVGGGTVDAVVSRQPSRRGAGLGGLVALRDLPSKAIAGLLGSDLALGGEVSTELRVGGTVAQPSLAGSLDLVRGWIGDTFVGDVQIAVADEPAADGTIALTGTALGGQLAVRAVVGLSAPYPVDVTLRGRRVEVDPLVDLTALLGSPVPVRAWATGTVSLHTELASATPPVAWIELDELTATAEYVDGDGRPLPLRLSAVPTGAGRPAVSLRATPTNVALVCRAVDNAGRPVPVGGGDVGGPCPVQLATPAGAVTLTGSGGADALAFNADGVLDLALLQPLLGEMFDDVRGTGDLHGEIVGTLAAPTYSMSVDLHDVRIRPAGQETVVRVPGGFVKLDNASIGFSDVVVQVDDTYFGKQSQLSLRGLVAHEDLTPRDWSLIIEGQLAGKMLLAVAPGVFSQATGVAVIDDALTISGRGAAPEISGSLSFDPELPLALVPRGLRREIAFSEGTIDVETVDEDASDPSTRTYGVTLEGIRGMIDGEGRLKDISGFVAIQDGEVASADVTIDATGVSFRIPRTLDLVLNATGMHVLRADVDAPLEIAGDVEVVSGTFTKNLESSTLLEPIAPDTDVRPFWEETPLIGEAVLDLGVQVSSLGVRSNFGSLDLLSKDLRVTGTPRDPRVEGQIEVAQGRLHIPGTRATFTRTSGGATFARGTKLLDGTPNVEITAEADYRDPGRPGQPHHPHAARRLPAADLGPHHVDRPHQGPDHHAHPGRPHARAAALEPGRRRDRQRPDADHDRADTTLTDQVLKDFAGDWISSQLGDQLRWIPLDVVRPYLVTGGVGFYGEKRLVENINLIGDGQWTTRGSLLDFRGELRTPSRLSLQVNYVRKSYADEAEDDVTDLQVKAVFRWLLF